MSTLGEMVKLPAWILHVGLMALGLQAEPRHLRRVFTLDHTSPSKVTSLAITAMDLPHSLVIAESQNSLHTLVSPRWLT